jgi:hypothetical protein
MLRYVAYDSLTQVFYVPKSEELNPIEIKEITGLECVVNDLDEDEIVRMNSILKSASSGQECPQRKSVTEESIS